MRIHRMKTGIVAVLALAAVAACSGGTTAPGNPSPGLTTTFSGVFGDGTSSGKFTVNVPATGSSQSRMPARAGLSADELPGRQVSDQTLASGTATGTLVFQTGATVSVTGTFSVSSGALALTGSGYTFTGSLTSGAVAGTYSGPNGTGNFSAQPPSASGAVAKTYCGTYETSSDHGWFNVAIAADGNFTGLAVSLLGGTSVGFGGTISGSALTATTSANGQIQATVSADGTAISGSYLPVGSAAGTGSLQGSTAACPAPGVVTAAGLWSNGAPGQSTNLHFVLTQAGDSLSGSGIITVNFVTNWTGNEFEITSGSFTNSQITFTARLGANPVGDGTFYYGTLTFTGTATNGTTATGTVVFTPPRTASQTFTQQTVTGLSFTKQ